MESQVVGIYGRASAVVVVHRHNDLHSWHKGNSLSVLSRVWRSPLQSAVGFISEFKMPILNKKSRSDSLTARLRILEPIRAIGSNHFPGKPRPFQLTFPFHPSVSVERKGLSASEAAWLHQFEPFSSVRSVAAIDLLQKSVVEKKLSVGKMLFAEGQIPPGIFIIRHGAVEVDKQSELKNKGTVLANYCLRVPSLSLAIRN